MAARKTQGPKLTQARSEHVLYRFMLAHYGHELLRGHSWNAKGLTVDEAVRQAVANLERLMRNGTAVNRMDVEVSHFLGHDPHMRAWERDRRAKLEEAGLL